MFNFSYVLPSALFLTVILGLYFSKPRLPIRAYKAFSLILVTEAFVIFMDIVSSQADNTFDLWPLWLLYLLNILYYIGFFIRSFLYFAFSVALVKIRDSEKRMLLVLTDIPMVVCCLIAATAKANGYLFSFGPEGFVRGPLNWITGACLMFYVLCSLIMVVTHRKAFDNNHSFQAGLNYNYIILLGAVFRRLFPNYLFLDAFCILAVLVMYLSYVNPDLHLETKMRIFNREALKNYLEEISGLQKYKVLAVGIHEYYDMRVVYGGPRMDEGLELIADELHDTYPEATCFYIQAGRFVMVVEKHANADRMIRELKERFKRPWKSAQTELYFEPVFSIIEPGDHYRSPDVIFAALTETMDQASPYSEECAKVTEASFEAAGKEAVYKQALEYAVDHDLMEVFLQPIFRDRSGQPVGAEALARIRDEHGNIVAPGYFISIAEKNGMINRLGEQVFEKVCRFLSEHDVKAWGMEYINVNISPLQFMKADLADRYSEIAARYHVDPAMIHLEITEEAMINEDIMNNHIRVLEQKGFRFALDDYGIGYSNISRLKRCPFSNVKLDMSLVWDFCKAPDEILPTMITAFRHMDFSVIAEGIETEDMAETMWDIGVEFLQGFYFAKPMPLQDFIGKYGATAGT